MTETKPTQPRTVRRQMLSCLVVLGGFVAVELSRMSGCCFGFQAALAEQDGRLGTSDPQPESELQNSAISHSAVPLGNRVLRDRLRRVREIIDRAEFTSAIAELKKIFEAESSTLILIEESPGIRQHYRSSQSVAAEILRQLPADAQSLYLRQTEPAARERLLKALHDSDFDALRKIVLRFPLTLAARDARRYLLAWHLDRREFATAASVAWHLASDPSLPDKLRTSFSATIEFCRNSQRREKGPAGLQLAPSERQAGSSHQQITSNGEVVEGKFRSSVKGGSLHARLFPSLTHPDWTTKRQHSPDTRCTNTSNSRSRFCPRLDRW